MPSTTTDRLAGGSTSVAIKAPVKAVSTEDLTLSGEQTVNGVVLVDGDRVLVKDQDTGSENGIYTVSTGSWPRAKDFDGRRDVVKGTLVLSSTDPTVAYRVTTSDPITIGTSSIAFSAVALGTPNYNQTAAEQSAGVTPTNYAYRHVNLRRFVTSGAGTTASPFVLSASFQDLLNGVTDMMFVGDPGYVYEMGNLSVSSTGRSTDSSLGSIYRAGIYFDFRGARVQIASGAARAIAFTDVTDFGILGGFWTGSPSEAMWKVNSTGTAVRTFYIAPDRVKGGATSGVGTDGVGLLLDSTSGNIADFHVGGARGSMWTHLMDCIYMKNTAPGSGIDTGIIENITGWPYGSGAAVGYTIRCEAAVDVVFRRIYGGLFEWDDAAAIYINPKYTDGIRNCRLELISADVSNSKTSCKTIKGLVNDSNKPIVGNTFDQIKIYKAASGTSGNNALSITTTNNAEFKGNLISGVRSNDTAGDQAIVLGQYSHDNYIIPSGDFDLSAISTWITDAGYRNTIVGRSRVIGSSNGRVTVTDANSTTAKTKTIKGGTLSNTDAVRISVDGNVATNANGATVALKFGATTLVSEVIAATGTGNIRLEAVVHCPSSLTQQRAFGRFIRGLAITGNTQSTPAETLSGDVNVTVVVTLNAVPAGDTVHIDTLDVELVNAPLS